MSLGNIPDGCIGIANPHRQRGIGIDYDERRLRPATSDRDMRTYRQPDAHNDPTHQIGYSHPRISYRISVGPR